MVDSRYLRDGFDFCLSHFIEECGEVLSAAGKTQRWGRDSIDPTITDPLIYKETNEEWLLRELKDLIGSIDRLKKSITD